MQNDEQRPISRAARLRWPIIIAGMLTAHVSAMMLAVHVATGDSGHTVVPDYYEKAVNWDERRAEERDSARLGWSALVTPSVLADAAGQRTLRAVVTDRLGQPVDGATVTARVWHHAVGAPSDVAFEAGAEPGLYVATAPMPQSGTWECELRAERLGDVFVQSAELDIASLAPR